MVTMKNLLGILMAASLALFPGLLRAEEAQVRASVDRTRVAVGESIQLKVTITGEDGEVDVSPIQDFEILSRGSSTNINMVNGQFSRENSYIYTLMPSKSGQMTVPPLPVRTNGKTLRTEAIKVTVTQSSEPDRAEDRDVFVEARVSNETPYEGQQIVYSFRLYQTVQIANAKFQEPSFSGFTAKRVEDQRTFETLVSGREYHVTELNFVLLPLSTNPQRIEPAILHCDVMRAGGRRRQSLFNDPFFGINGRRFETRRFATDPVTVSVQPLPPYKGDGRFSGLVGKFDIESKIESRQMRVGDSTTLSIVIRGSGNVMDAEEPAIPVSDAFKVYQDAPEESVRLEPSGYSGQKVFRMALVPVNPGEYQLDSARLVYFDPSRGEYVDKSTQPFDLKVLPAQAKDQLAVFSAAPPGVTGQKDRVVFTGRDILPLKENPDALKTRRPMSGGLFLLLLIIPPAVFGMVKTTMRLTRKSDDPSRIMLERSEKAFREAEAAESGGEAFFSPLHRSVVSAIFAKAGTLGEALTHAEVRSTLNDGGAAPQTVAMALVILETIESARFGGMNLDPEDRQTLLNQTRKLRKALNP